MSVRVSICTGTRRARSPLLKPCSVTRPRIGGSDLRRIPARRATFHVARHIREVGVAIRAISFALRKTSDVPDLRASTRGCTAAGRAGEILSPLALSSGGRLNARLPLLVDTTSRMIEEPIPC